MKQEDKLRNTLREYYDNQELPYNNEDWQKASAYIDAAKRKKKFRGIVFSLLILLPALFVFFFNLPDSSNNNEQTSSQKKANAPTNRAEKKQFEPEAPTLAAQNKPGVPNLNRQVEHKENTFHAADKTRASGMQVKHNGQAVPENFSPAPEILAAVPQLNFADTENSVLKTARAEKDLVITTTLSSVDRSPDPEDYSSGPFIEKTTPLAPAIKPGIMIQHPTEEQQGPDAWSPGKKNETIPEETLTLTKPEERIKAQNTDADALPTAQNADEMQNMQSVNTATTQKEFPDTGLTIPVKTKALPLDTFSSLSFADTVSSYELETWDTLRRPSREQLAGEGIFYEAGAAWYYGWKGPGKIDARGFSPMAGINYMNSLNKRCAISFGARYLMVSGLSNSSKTSRVSSYVYGEQSQVTVITPTRLHYLLVPLRFHFYADRYNCFGTGLNLGYLLNVEAKVTRYEETAGVKGAEETIRQGGYTEGFSWFDTQVAVFYRRKINASLALQTELFIGLSDVKQDAFFGYSHKERNSGATLSLVYYAFKKNKR